MKNTSNMSKMYNQTLGFSKKLLKHTVLQITAQGM